MNKFRFALVLVLISLLGPLTVQGAGLFPDVSNNHLFKAEIESLARAGTVKGNPDGNFYPDRSVNRAEFLKMLYTATGRTPKAIYQACFDDVVKGSWYELIVCDAASKENGFVQGYADKKFRPGNPVSRIEALKMTFMLFGLKAADVTSDQKDLVKFVDISTSAWYSKYIVAAYGNGLLPIAGQSSVRFYPDKELSRGEAAAYIYNAEKALERQSQNVETSSSSSSASAVTSSSSSKSSSSAPADIVKNVDFPFSDAGQFQGKRPTAYLFSLKQKTEVLIHVAVSGYYVSDVSCRMYLLNENGFSDEYYLGFQSKSECLLKVALRPGSYQLQVQPTTENVPFTVSTSVDTGDGNDGFIEAPSLKFGLSKTDILSAGDIVDWYSFPVDADKTMTVQVSTSEDIQCIIYTPSSVDQYGFKGPECGKPYLFKAADSSTPYMLGIGRKIGDTIHRVPYTVKVY